MADWITTEQAANQTQFTADYIRRLARAGKVKGRKWGHSWQVSKSSLLAYLRHVSELGARRGRKRKT